MILGYRYMVGVAACTQGGIFYLPYKLESVAWDATGGCWQESLPCFNLCVAVGAHIHKEGYLLWTCVLWCLVCTWCS